MGGFLVVEKPMSIYHHRGEGRGTVDILLSRAADMERWAKEEERYVSRNRYASRNDRQEALREAEKWRREAARLLERTLQEDAECQSDPVAATGFSLREPVAPRIGRARPPILAGKGGSAMTRQQAKRQRHR